MAPVRYIISALASVWDLLLFAYELKTGIQAKALYLTQLYS